MKLGNPQIPNLQVVIDNVIIPSPNKNLLCDILDRTENGSEIDLTTTVPLNKKGEVRKRKQFATSQQQRKEEIILQNAEKLDMKPACPDNCSKKCNSLITEPIRVLINKNYRQLGYVEKQRFILSHTSETKLNSNKNDSDNDSKRKIRNIHFFLQDEKGERIRTCKTLFLTTIGYHKKNDRFVLQTIFESEDHMAVRPDMRGKYIMSFK